MTSDEHINAMPDGSRSVNGRKAYPAESRARDETYLVVNEAAERRQISARLSIGEYTPIRNEDIWRNVGDNLGRESTKQRPSISCDVAQSCAEARLPRFRPPWSARNNASATDTDAPCFVRNWTFIGRDGRFGRLPKGCVNVCRNTCVRQFPVRPNAMPHVTGRPQLDPAVMPPGGSKRLIAAKDCPYDADGTQR